MDLFIYFVSSNRVNTAPPVLDTCFYDLLFGLSIQYKIHIFRCFHLQAAIVLEDSSFILPLSGAAL
jgi:hypothetical protein